MYLVIYYSSTEGPLLIPGVQKGRFLFLCAPGIIWFPWLQAKAAAGASLEKALAQLQERSRSTETKLQVSSFTMLYCICVYLICTT